MASPEPEVALKNQCSILHDNILYTYSPDAFQSLPLTKNATWSELSNGVSVTGAICVKGGVNGDNSRPALYVVGGTTNSSTTGYTGLQRYSILDRTWETISPISWVTANRLNHGATYLNASSAILIYGGSQDGNTHPSTETFLMLMYPPFRVQAYPSIAPPATNPSLMPYDEQRAVMVGGGNGNKKVFTFHPDPGWVDLGVSLPFVLPEPSVGQVNLQWLADGSRVLETYYTNESPNRVARNVLATSGGAIAQGQEIGGPAATHSRFMRRQLSLADYPSYNSSNAPLVQRTGASLASENGQVAIVGGDSNSTVNVFDSNTNSWVNNTAIFGNLQKPLTASTSSASPTATSTPSSTLAATPAATTSAVAAPKNSQTNSLAILGGVLGGICAFAAILIILLLWLRSVKKRKTSEGAAKKDSPDNSPFPDDKLRAVPFEDDGGLKPLSHQAQPMGRSPVPSAAFSEADSVAMFGGRPAGNDKAVEAGFQPGIPSKLGPGHRANESSLSGFFKSNNKTPLSISKPMDPDLGHYQERPVIDLGKATPAGTTPAAAAAAAVPATAAAAAIVSSQSKADQRKTDEGWAKYFQSDKPEKSQEQTNPYAVSYEDDPRRSTSRPNTSKGGGTGFWPGAGVPTSNRSNTKLPLRDSAGNPLTHAAVASASPSLGNSDSNPQTRNMSIAEPARAKISRAESISTNQTSDDEYEDEEVDAYSERSSYPQQWNPMNNRWTGQSQRMTGATTNKPTTNTTVFPFANNHSTETANTSNSGGSSLPAFPMPAASIGRADTTDQYIAQSVVEKPPQGSSYAPKNPYAHARKSSHTMNFSSNQSGHDYFGPSDTASTRTGSMSKATDVTADPTDMSWLNLGTPAGMNHGTSSHSKDPA